VQPLYLHDQRTYPIELRLYGEYAVSDVVGLEAQVPFRSVTTTIDFTTPDRRVYQPLDPDVHHRDETIIGPADPWLLVRFGLLFERWWLAARPGVTLPLGKTEEDPFALGDRGLRHQHIQLGTGTFDPVLVLEASRQFDPVNLQLFGQGSMSVYENGHGFRGPVRLYGGASAGTGLVGGLSGSLGLEAMHEGAERWAGEVRQDGSLGRSEFLAAASLVQKFGNTQLSLDVRVPFYRHIIEGTEAPGTLESPLALTLGVSQLVGDEHED
jgi:hypothetical protein